MTGPDKPDRTLPWLHLFRPSGRQCAAGLATHGDLRGRRPADTRRRFGRDVAGRASFVEGPAERDRHPQRLDWSVRSSLLPRERRARHARLRRLRRLLRRRGCLFRVTGDIIALSPPLIIEKDEIGNDRLHPRRRPEAGGLINPSLASRNRGQGRCGERPSDAFYPCAPVIVTGTPL
jgi:hypothetical protein